MNTRHALLALALCLAVAAVAQAEATFWDLLIHPEVRNNPVPEGGSPEVRGRIVDHGGDVVAGANVSVRTLGHTVWLVTDTNGTFAHTFNETGSATGLHSVKIHATADGLGGEKIGFADVTYRIGEGSDLSTEEKILATEDAKKYLAADEDDFENDLIGASLYEYYSNLYKKHMDKIAKQQKIEEQNYEILQSRLTADNTTKQLIKKDEKRTGHISKYAYEKLISNTDPSIRNDVIRQINYTVNSFKVSQYELNQTQESVGQNATNNPIKNHFSREVLSRVLAGDSYEDIMKYLQRVNSTENATLAESNSTAVLQLPTEQFKATTVNQTTVENVIVSEPAYDLHISATAVDWNLPPSGTVIDLTGAAIGLSPTGNIMVGINGTLVELKLHAVNITK